MAFVLLLVLSLTTLIQVETRLAQTNLNQLKARESARLALTMAVAQLQQNAGHDQRTTARAEIAGNDKFDLKTRFWTGVWDATDMDKAPVWLVSGEDADSDTEPDSPMQLVGQGTVGNDASQSVYVPTIETLNANGIISSRLGWWTSDEGVKTSIVGLAPNTKHALALSAGDDDLQLQTVFSQGLEALFDQYDRFSSSSVQLLDRITAIEQLAMLDGFRESIPDTSQEVLFHTLTLNSLGVLASTQDTGLMQDLSLFPALLETGLQNYLQLGEKHADQLAAQTNPLAKKLLITEISGLDNLGDLKDGDIATPIIPILSNFMIAFTIRSQDGAEPDGKFRLRSKFFCEFWNPFTHTLSMTNDQGESVDLELEITGLPEVTVRGTSESSAPIDLQRVMGDPSKNNAVVIRLVNKREEPWLPGRSKNWTGLQTIDNSPQSPYRSIDTETKRWIDDDNTLGSSEGINTGVTRVTGNLQITSREVHELRIKVYKIKKSSRELVSDLNGLSYEPVTTRGGHSNTHSGMTFGYHINLREPYHSNNDSEFHRGRWLKDHDPRSPIPLFRTDWHAPQNTSSTGSPYIPVKDGFVSMLTPEPAVINEGDSTINFKGVRRLLDRSKNNLNKLWQDAPLFELPRRRILSLASLQHIYIHNERPFQVGNSWGNQGKYNTSGWFDRYYFSGLSRSDEMDGFEPHIGPQNPCLRFVNTNSLVAAFESWKINSPDDSIAARNPAQHLMVANRFNINSTSVSAWKSVLSSLRIHDFDHLYWSKGDTSDLDTLGLISASREESGFTRFSHSLEETYQSTAPPPEIGNEPVAPSAFYRHGARRLKAEDIESLAQEIVRLIQQKGRPFKSMEEFLSELSPNHGSLLEQAIRNVLTNPVTKRQQWQHNWETEGNVIGNETPVEIDHFAPGFLTQADIMTAIGPMLAARSDTFKIRARGECFDDFGEQTGSATIEAILQRTPEAVDSTTSVAAPSNRKFKIISIRWLTDSEI